MQLTEEQAELNTKLDYQLCELLNCTIDELDQKPLPEVEQMRLLLVRIRWLGHRDPCIDWFNQPRRRTHNEKKNCL